MTDNPNESNFTSQPQTRVYDLSDKLKIINQALINTGNNPVNVADDTSDEWIAANNAFEQNVIYLLGKKDWNFATDTVELARLGDSNFPGYRDVYAKPADCIQFINAWRLDSQQRLEQWLSGYHHAMADVYPPSLTYKIIADNIHTVAPKGLRAYYSKFPTGAEAWSTGFVACLRAKIEANLYRSLNEDGQMAGAWEKYAEDMLRDAISRNAEEEPARVMFKSRLQMIRRIRRYGDYYR
jgi:hypothetical protein